MEASVRAHEARGNAFRVLSIGLIITGSIDKEYKFVVYVKLFCAPMWRVTRCYETPCILRVNSDRRNRASGRERYRSRSSLRFSRGTNLD